MQSHSTLLWRSLDKQCIAVTGTAAAAGLCAHHALQLGQHEHLDSRLTLATLEFAHAVVLLIGTVDIRAVAHTASRVQTWISGVLRPVFAHRQDFPNLVSSSGPSEVERAYISTQGLFMRLYEQCGGADAARGERATAACSFLLRVMSYFNLLTATFLACSHWDFYVSSFPPKSPGIEPASSLCPHSTTMEHLKYVTSWAERTVHHHYVHFVQCYQHPAALARARPPAMPRLFQELTCVSLRHLQVLHRLANHIATAPCVDRSARSKAFAAQPAFHTRVTGASSESLQGSLASVFYRLNVVHFLASEASLELRVQTASSESPVQLLPRTMRAADVRGDAPGGDRAAPVRGGAGVGVGVGAGTGGSAQDLDADPTAAPSRTTRRPPRLTNVLHKPVSLPPLTRGAPAAAVRTSLDTTPLDRSRGLSPFSLQVSSPPVLAGPGGLPLQQGGVPGSVEAHSPQENLSVAVSSPSEEEEEEEDVSPEQLRRATPTEGSDVFKSSADEWEESTDSSEEEHRPPRHAVHELPLAASGLGDSAVEGSTSPSAVSPSANSRSLQALSRPGTGNAQWDGSFDPSGSAPGSEERLPGLQGTQGPHHDAVAAADYPSAEEATSEYDTSSADGASITSHEAEQEAEADARRPVLPLALGGLGGAAVNSSPPFGSAPSAAAEKGTLVPPR